MQLYRCDCLKVMGEIPDGSIDLILADLPYGTTACKWDVIIPFGPLWAHYRRLLKPRGAVVLTGSQPFTSMLVMSNPKWFRYCLVWEKSLPTGFLSANRKPLKSHEDIAIFSPRQTTYNPQKWKGNPNHAHKPGDKLTCNLYRPLKRVTNDLSGMKYPRSVIHADKHSSTERFHPTQKPVALMEYLVRTYSNEGDTVLDNAMGSGTTGVACLNTGRDFIGIESYEPYFSIAERRIAEATPQADVA